MSCAAVPLVELPLNLEGRRACSLILTFACSSARGDGALGCVGLITDEGKIYGEALARLGVEEFHTVEWDDHVSDGVRTGSLTLPTYSMIV